MFGTCLEAFGNKVDATFETFLGLTATVDFELHVS